MKKYIIPTVECYNIQSNVTFLAGSVPDRTDMGLDEGGFDENASMDSRNNNSNDLWNSGW